MEEWGTLIYEDTPQQKMMVNNMIQDKELGDWNYNNPNNCRMMIGMSLLEGKLLM